MENRYDKHFMLDSKSVVDFIKYRIDYFDETAEIEAYEIGDGNINYVFKVVDRVTGKSLVVKQSDKFLRTSGRPLDQKRNKIEYMAIEIEEKLSNGKVPHIFAYDENMHTIIMEDISDYKNLRKELDKEIIFQNLPESISDFLADTLLPTTDLVLPRDVKKEQVQLFINTELCDISEDLVFTEPYYDYKGRNIITNGMQDFVEKELYNDQYLIAEVGILRNNFMNNAQALIHGDLHSGSIFINEKGIKIIDPEFAFYGPIGYDIGNVIGNLFFSLANKFVLGEKEEGYTSWISQAIIDIYDLTRSKLIKKFKNVVQLPIYNDIFMNKYVSCVFSDTIGYAGTEIIRRTVGDSKVSEITSVEDHNNRIKLETILIKLGKKLIINRNHIDTGKKLMKEFREAVDQCN